ncbi:NPCBM/NEW2 domain-containing protein [Luteolibacter soli]|uniref:NPCBM/NEW2 domain-containing protein n=1 Tax=Luteolibacter soli TaxID=3135280 RepID=A0ABU9AVK9_9BACT
MRPVVLRLFFAAAPLAAAEPAVTDADLAVANQSYGELRRDLSVDGNPLRSGGNTFASGLGSHASAEVPVTVPAGTARFSGAAGVDEEVGAGKGSVRFRILSGDAVLWESPVMKAGDAPAVFDIAVSAKTHRRLYLQADALDGNSYDHADWLDLKWTTGDTPDAGPTKIFSSEEFGLTPGDEKDQTPALRLALAALRSSPGSTLKLAKGVYHFHETGALKRHYHVSNHDQPEWQPVSVPLVDLRDVTLDGSGSTFLFHGSPAPFLIQDSEKVTVRGIAVDYVIPHLAQGIVTATGPGWYEMTVDPEKFPHEVRNGWFTFRGDGWANPAGKGGIVFKASNGMIAPETADYNFGGPLTMLAPGRYRVEKDIAQSGIGTGDVLTLRQGPSRPHPAFVLYRAKDTVLEDCPIHAAHGMGILAQRSENIRVTGGGTHPAPGSGLHFSTNADATHYSNCKGLIVEENGLYSGMMDDAINVHATCLHIVEKVDAHTLRCRYMHEQAVGFEIALPGESLRFIKASTLTDGETRRIARIRRLSTQDILFTFETPVPDAVAAGDALENPDWHPEVIFRGNTVTNNRARGALFTTNRPVLVENNRFVRSSGSAILLAGDANGWFESGACHDVLIRKNLFEDNLTSRYQFTEALIAAYPEVPDLKDQTTRYHRNVRIEDNDFKTFDVPLVFAISVDGLAFTGNRVTYNTNYKSWNRPPFDFRSCDHTVIRDNKVENLPAERTWPE